MEKSVFKRKIYNEILEWKENRSDKYALLIKGAKRIGKRKLRTSYGGMPINKEDLKNENIKP